MAQANYSLTLLRKELADLNFSLKTMAVTAAQYDHPLDAGRKKALKKQKHAYQQMVDDIEHTIRFLEAQGERG